MPKVWSLPLLGWFAALTAHGCSVDQRSLGSLAAPRGEAGAAVDAVVDGFADSQDALPGDGAGAEVWVPFGPVTLHPALANLPASQVDPTMTADERELYFASNPNTDWDIWVVQRASSTAPWGTPAKVIELSSSSKDETPEVSADGLTIYLASDRTGGPAGEHLWVSHRATRAASWDPPLPVTDFVGGDADLSPSLQHDELVMVFASQRGSVDWNLYATARQSTTDLWGTPTLLTELNSTAADWDPALYRGGTSIVFASQRLGGRNSLFYATRETVTEQFSVPQPATELNVNGEGDPWLSDDGHHILFDSHRAGGPTKIYEASR